MLYPHCSTRLSPTHLMPPQPISLNMPLKVGIWLSCQLLNLLPDKAEGLAFPLSLLGGIGMKLSRIGIIELFCEVLRVVHETKDLDFVNKNVQRSVSSCRCGLWNSENSPARTPFRPRIRSMSLYPKTVPGELVQIRLQ